MGWNLEDADAILCLRNLLRGLAYAMPERMLPGSMTGEMIRQMMVTPLLTFAEGLLHNDAFWAAPVPRFITLDGNEVSLAERRTVIQQALDACRTA